MTCGRISASANSRTVRRRSSLLFGRAEVHSANYNGHGSHEDHKVTKITKIVLVRDCDAAVREPRLAAADCLPLLCCSADRRSARSPTSPRSSAARRRRSARTRGASRSARDCVIVGFEFEYSATDEDLDGRRRPRHRRAGDRRPSCSTDCCRRRSRSRGCSSTGRSGAASITKRCRLEPDDDETNFGTNVGGGAKITLAGPLRVRLDYRVFTLRGTPRHTNVAAVLRGGQSEILKAETQSRKTNLSGSFRLPSAVFRLPASTPSTRLRLPSPILLRRRGHVRR